MKRSQFRLLRTPTFLFTAFLVLVGVMGFVHVTASKQAWQYVLARADAWQEEIESRDRTREVLWGEAIDGEAWPHYESAIAELSRIPAAGERTRHAWRDRNKGLENELDEISCQAQLALDALRKGAHRTRGSRIVDLNLGMVHPIAGLMVARDMVNVAMARFRIDLEAGRQADAIHVFLDALQFARDLGDSPFVVEEMIGIALVALCHEHLVEDDVWPLLSEASVRSLSDGFEIIDKTLSERTTNLTGESVAFVRSIETIGFSSMVDFDALNSWRYGFSYPLMMQHGFEQIVEAKAEIEFLQIARSSARHSDIDSYCASFDDHPNVFLAAQLPVAASTARSRLLSIADVRMLRIALADRMDERLTLEDPFGASFVEKRSAGRLRIETPSFHTAYIEVADVEHAK